VSWFCFWDFFVFVFSVVVLRGGLHGGVDTEFFVAVIVVVMLVVAGVGLRGDARGGLC